MSAADAAAREVEITRLHYCSAMGPTLREGATARAPEALGDAATGREDGGACGGGWWRDVDAGANVTGASALPGPSRRRGVPDPPRRGTRVPRGGRVGAAERARHATADRAPRGGCNASSINVAAPPCRKAGRRDQVF